MKLKIQTPYLVLAVVTTIAFTVFSCGKKENQAPVITITKPADNDTITIPDSLHMEGTITDDKSLHEMSVLVIGATGDTSFQEKPYVHNLKTYKIRYDFFPSVAGTYTLQVTAQDHDSKSSTATRNITVN